MRKEVLELAENEARRFLAAAAALRERLKTDPALMIVGSRESGSVRRASLDLTRALADLRSRG